MTNLRNMRKPSQGIGDSGKPRNVEWDLKGPRSTWRIADLGVEANPRDETAT